MKDDEESLRLLANSWRLLQKLAEGERLLLIEATNSALDAGRLSEYRAAKAANVSRVTIRTWRGKDGKGK